MGDKRCLWRTNQCFFRPGRVVKVGREVQGQRDNKCFVVNYEISNLCSVHKKIFFFNSITDLDNFQLVTWLYFFELLIDVKPTAKNERGALRSRKRREKDIKSVRGVGDIKLLQLKKKGIQPICNVFNYSLNSATTLNSLLFGRRSIYERHLRGNKFI